MEILSRSSLIMPPSSCLRQHQLSDEECYSSVGASPVISPSPIASPPSVLLAPPPLPSTDCSCSDFWFGSEDSMQTKIIHSRYMHNFDLSTTRQHASRAPIAFIGLIIRRRITKQIYYQIMQSSHVTMQNNHNNANQKMKRKKKQKGDGSSDHSLSDDDRWHCCESNESPTDCDSCRLYTIDEITINQRDCVPLGFTMKRIESSTVVTIWDNYDGLPLHQHRLRRWPEGIIEKNSLKPHSYIECNPLYDDDPTGLHCTDASFVYSTHRFTNHNLHANVSATSGERMCLGYASMNQPCILDALRRFGRPSDAEAVRQLNATGQEGAETDETHTGAHPHTNVSVCTQPNDDDAENNDDRTAENEVDHDDDDDADDQEWSDDANDEDVDGCSDDEDNQDNDDVDDEDDLPSSAQPNPLRRHHTDGIIEHRGSRSKSVRSQSDDDAHEAAKLMAKLGLCTLSDDSSHQKMLKNTRNKFSGSTDAECDDDDDDLDERLSDDDQFSIHLHPCDHGWK